MSSTNFNPFVPNTMLEDIENWDQHVANGVDWKDLGYENDQEAQRCLGLLLRNGHNVTSSTAKNYVDGQISALVQYMNDSFRGLIERNAALRTELDLHKALLENYKAQLDKIPAGAGSGGIARIKLPDPPTFQGSSDNLKLQEWLNHIMLYCSASGIVTEKQQIVCALTRLRGPAANYMIPYYEKNRQNKDLGSWDDFVAALDIYGRRDDKEGAKVEITQLWTNKTLASKDFIKYAEQYRTLARIVEYEDNIHIDKLREVLPQDMRNALVSLEITGTVPKKWAEYLDLLIRTYKALHPEKAKGTIFGTSNGSGNGNGENKKQSDPNAMEIDQAKKTKGHQANSQEASAKKHCNICHAKGLKQRAKTHNTNDCYDKPGNEDKRPAPRASTSTPSTSGSNKGNNSSSGGKKSFKMRLLELLEEEDDDGPATPAATVNINSARITEVVEPEQADKRAAAEVNEPQAGPSKPTGKGKKVDRRAQVDFPEGL
jgi:hypothetical protein